MNDSVKFIDLFAGVGGFHLGLHRAGGYECVWASEWDRYSSSVYRHNFPHTPLSTDDINTVEADDIPNHDILCAGFPCQAFSIAGKRQGFKDATRGKLFFEIARIAEAKRPRILLLENVKGILNHGKGNTFYTILGTLDEMGYHVEWQVLNSKYFSVPQTRERTIIIGYLGDRPRQTVFPISEVSSGFIEAQREAGVGGQRIRDEHNSNTGDKSTPSDKSTSRSLRVGGSGLEENLIRMVMIHASFPGEVRTYESISPTISTPSGGRHLPFVASMLKAPNYKDIDLTTIPDRPFQLVETRTEKGKESRRNIRKTEGRDSTLRGEEHKKYVPKAEDVANCLTTGDKNVEKWVFVEEGLRRITPVECERLQGFPDDWTSVGRRLDGTVYSMSDTQRYKQMGNAVSVPVVEYIGRQLKNII